MKILFVCIGNICRSPIAHGVMEHLANKKGYRWEVDSAAVRSYHVGEPPHPNSIKICKNHGIDISDQKARVFSINDFDYYDHIFVMAADVYKEIELLSRSGVDMNKVDYFRNISQPQLNLDVPDPWYGDWKDYVSVYDLIADNCKRWVNQH